MELFFQQSLVERFPGTVAPYMRGRGIPFPLTILLYILSFGIYQSRSRADPRLRCFPTINPAPPPFPAVSVQAVIFRKTTDGWLVPFFCARTGPFSLIDLPLLEIVFAGLFLSGFF